MKQKYYLFYLICHNVLNGYEKSTFPYGRFFYVKNELKVNNLGTLSSFIAIYKLYVAIVKKKIKPKILFHKMIKTK